MCYWMGQTCKDKTEGKIEVDKAKGIACTKCLEVNWGIKGGTQIGLFGWCMSVRGKCWERRQASQQGTNHERPWLPV